MQTSHSIAILIAAVVLIGGILLFTRADAPRQAEEPRLEHVHGIAVDSANPERLLIATHHGLLELVDGRLLARVGTSQDDLMGFTPHPTDPATYFSSGHPAGGGNLGFQKSTDGGVSWQKVSDGVGGPVDFHSMTVSMANPDLLYGFYRLLQRSTDGGRMWEVAKGAVRPISLSTDPKRESVVYAATDSGIMVSEDRGDSWRSLSSALEGGAASVIAFDPAGEYALAYSLKLGGLGKSADGGATWQKIDEEFNGEAVLYIAYSRDGSRVYALTEKDSLYASTDKGETWANIR